MVQTWALSIDPIFQAHVSLPYAFLGGLGGVSCEGKKRNLQAETTEEEVADDLTVAHRLWCTREGRCKVR